MTSNATVDEIPADAAPADDRPSIQIVPFKHDHSQPPASSSPSPSMGELAVRASSVTNSSDPEEIKRRDLLAEIRGERAQLVATARDLKGPARQIRRATRVVSFATRTARVIAVAASIAGLLGWMRGGKRPSTLLLLSLSVEVTLALRHHNGDKRPAKKIHAQNHQARRRAITQ